MILTLIAIAPLLCGQIGEVPTRSARLTTESEPWVKPMQWAMFGTTMSSLMGGVVALGASVAITSSIASIPLILAVTVAVTVGFAVVGAVVMGILWLRDHFNRSRRPAASLSLRERVGVRVRPQESI